LRLLVLDRLERSILRQLLLLRLDQIHHSLPDGRQLGLDVLHQHHIHGPHQRSNPHLLIHVAILLVLGEELLLPNNLLIQGPVGFGGPEVYAGVSQQQLVGEGVVVFEDVDAVLNQVDLSQHPNGSDSLPVDFPGQFERLGVGGIFGGLGNGDDEAILVADVGLDHLGD